MSLYHSEVWMPKEFQTRFKCRLTYQLHALNAAKDDRYGDIRLPERFDSNNARLIEVEAIGMRVVKRVYRQSLDASRDLVLVINPDGRVRTVWINLKSDPHSTLRRDRYVARPSSLIH